MALATEVQWVDVSLSFQPIPGSGDIGVKKNEEAIKGSIRNLVLRSHYEVPFHSEEGSDAANILFDNFNPVSIGAMRDSLIRLLTAYEPRAFVNDIQILTNPDGNYIIVTIIFTPINSTNQVTVTVPLKRTR